MNPHLFVYGTLRHVAVGEPGQNERQRLQRAARWLGPATIQGQLYNLGRYPGLILSSDATDIVHGEVVELFRPAESLPWLDAYEGLTPEAPAAAEYRRCEATVRLLTGRELLAWVYIYQHSCSPAQRLEEGRWPPPLPGSGVG